VFFTHRYGKLLRYDLSTPYDLSTASNLQNVSINGTYYDEYRVDLSISEDGKTIFIMSKENNKISQYTLTTAFDLTTMSLTSHYSFSKITGVHLLNAKYFILNETSGNKMKLYKMSTDWDITSAVWQKDLLTNSNSVGAVMYRNNKIYTFDGSSGNTLYAYTTDKSYASLNSD
jgi:hypothetical protein